MSDSSKTSPILVRIDRRGAHGHVATGSINNAARGNCLGQGQIDAFIQTVAARGQAPGLGGLIVTGEGDRAFMGGANLFELGELNPIKARAFLTGVHGMSKALRDLAVPTIARVNGFCLGAGLEVMAACDMRVASDNAVFGMPEVKIGLPSVVEAALLPQLIGWGKTKVLLYTGDNIDAPTALVWGLTEKTVAPADLEAAVEDRVGRYAGSGPGRFRL